MLGSDARCENRIDTVNIIGSIKNFVLHLKLVIAGSALMLQLQLPADLSHVAIEDSLTLVGL